MNSRLPAISAAVGAFFLLRTTQAGIVANSVVSYSAGDLAGVPSESTYTNSLAALGPLTGDTGIGTPYGANGLNPFDPPFTSGQITAIGAGGQMTLRLSQPLSTAGGPTLGVFSNNGLVDISSDGSGLATSPASTFDDPNYPEAVVSVSQDGVNFVTLNGGNPIVFSNPTNYYLDSPISFYTQPLGRSVANQYQPFNGSLASFNGENYPQMLTTLNGSAGGTWLDLSGTGLTSINEVQFVVPADAGYTMVLDGVSGSQAAGRQLTWQGGPTWDTVASNWQTAGTGSTIFSNTTNTTSGDNVLFDDSATSTNLIISGTVRPTTIAFNNSTHTFTISAANSSSGIAGPGSLTVNGTAAVILSSNNTYTGGTWVNSGQLIVTTAGAYPANTPLYVLPTGTVRFNSGTGLIALSAISNNGLIDIKNNSLVVHNGDVGAITAQVAAAYNNGAWDGTSTSGAITSSTAGNDSTHLTAIGVAANFNSFEGSTVVSTDVLIKYTYDGDANLDGAVNSADYSLIDNGFLTQGTNAALTGWQNGDFNYDGVINGSDYTLIDNAFNQQGAAISDQIAVSTTQIAGVASVPEPTIALLWPAVALMGRRRRLVRCV